MKRVFWIDDGGEVYWYVALTTADAKAEHRRLFYENHRVEFTDEIAEALQCAPELPDKAITLDLDSAKVTLPADSWAHVHDLFQGACGFMGTTAL